MTMHERLRDNPSDWGLTAAQFTSREKARTREREKKRRQRALQALRPKISEEPAVRYSGDVFVTTSGAMAYVKRVPNRTALGIPMTNKATHDLVSLPYVSILFG